MGRSANLKWALGLMLFVAAIASPGAAWADQVVIQRHVTVREGPSRQTGIITFPSVGSRLELLDDGRRVRGYYHVRLPDGRQGWVYYTFVRREADALSPAAASEQMTVHFIDVDQGAAALLEFTCGALLIDAGGRGAAAGDHLIEYLRAFFDRRPELGNRLAAIFLTHAHQDHNLYLRRVAEAFVVGGFIYNGKQDNRTRRMVERGNAEATFFPIVPVTEQLVEASGAAAGVTNPIVDPVNCAGVDPEVRVLSGGHSANPGWSTAEFNQPNNHSLVIRVQGRYIGFQEWYWERELAAGASEDDIKQYPTNLVLGAMHDWMAAGQPI